MVQDLEQYFVTLMVQDLEHYLVTVMVVLYLEQYIIT